MVYYLNVYQHVVFQGTSGEEMSLWTEGGVKVAETLDGGGGGLPDQPDAAAFKNILDWEQINSTVGSV
jgi:hypothetical protein